MVGGEPLKGDKGHGVDDPPVVQQLKSFLGGGGVNTDVFVLVREPEYIAPAFEASTCPQKTNTDSEVPPGDDR